MIIKENEVKILPKEEKKEAVQEENFDKDCPICLTIMAEPCKLPCGHRFCIMCIDKVFMDNAMCPICRKKEQKAVNLAIDKEF